MREETSCLPWAGKAGFTQRWFKQFPLSREGLAMPCVRSCSEVTSLNPMCWVIFPGDSSPKGSRRWWPKPGALQLCKELGRLGRSFWNGLGSCHGRASFDSTPTASPFGNAGALHLWRLVSNAGWDPRCPSQLFSLCPLSITAPGTFFPVSLLPAINVQGLLLQVWLVEALVELCQGASMVSALSFLTSGVIPQVPNLHIHFPMWDFLQE